MPIIRRRRNYLQLSEFETGRIINLHEVGLGFREIARRVERLIVQG